MSERTLRIQGLTIEIAADARACPRKVVDGVDLDVGSGETVVLAGESGSGKTLTALAIARLLPVSARIRKGTIEVCDREVTTLDRRALVALRGGTVSYVFQEPAAFLNPLMTIGDQIAESIILHQRRSRHEARAEALRLLGAVRIDDPARVLLDYPHQLSGGMNQRAFIAMALACRPRLMIADEPTTALDVTVEAQILELLQLLKKEMGFSLLFITHNLSIARRIADRICIMYQGKIVEAGGVEEIFSAPRHFHTKELIEAYEEIGIIA
ncbi:MAG: ABC transporter ATP-binding protein [Candidatus Omnitrophota bacterium]